MKYEDMLKEGMKKVPKTAVESARFEVPKAKVLKQGNKTLLNNVFEIAAAIRREPQHLIKFLSLELGTSYDVKDKNVSFIGNFSGEYVDRKIQIYMKSYVLCSECNKPDTRLLTENNMNFIRCEACGARHPVKKL